MIDFSKIGVREQASLSSSIFIALNIDRVTDVVIEKARYSGGSGGHCLSRAIRPTHLR